MVAAFSLSLSALTACDLVEGSTLYYRKTEEQQSVYDDPCEPNPCELFQVCLVQRQVGENSYYCYTPSNETATASPYDPNYDPSRYDPSILDQETFTLGVFKAKDVSQGYLFAGCIDYSNDVTDVWLDDGAAEGTARFFGTLAATFGGIGIFGFLALAASRTTNRLYALILGGVLVAAAFSQMFIFTIFSSKHCDKEFWEDYRSVEELMERTAVATSCKMGDGGWLALIALLLYIFAALLAMTKWSDPSYQLCIMEWNKDLSADGGRYETTRTWVPHGQATGQERAKSTTSASSNKSPEPVKKHEIRAMDSTEEYEDEHVPFRGPGPDDDTSV